MKDLLEWDSNQRPSAPNAPNTTAGPPHLEKGGHQTIGGVRDVDVAKDGESHLDGTKDNDEILQMAEEKRSLIGIIRSRQRNWLGNIMRG